MKGELNMELKPYDYDVADEVFSSLFTKGLDRGDGLIEIPAASLQLVVSALEYIAWDVYGENRAIVKTATAIVENLRDAQKRRENNRKG